MENKHTLGDLYQMQSLPLQSKIRMTERRIEGWIDEFGEEGVYISFSGGKDSTVLMDIIRNKMGCNIPAMFVDVPTQYPELKEFAKTWDNLDIIRPNISFMEVCDKYGFPLISKEVGESVNGARKYLTQIQEELASYRTEQNRTEQNRTEQNDSLSILLRKNNRNREVSDKGEFP